ESRPALRNAALGALQDELADTRGDWEADHLKGPAVRRTLRDWIADAAFPSERRADFAVLPATEKAAWTAFWGEVRRLLADLDALILPAGASVRQTLSAKALS